jgi:hypothetical protein
VGAAAGLAVAALVLWGASALPWPPPGAPSWTGGVAVLALAGIAGVVATSGLFRRGVGVLLAAVGGAVLVGAVAEFAASLFGASALVVSGLALLGTGVLVAAREPGLARFGARYARAGASPADPDRAAWDALDEGRDPTVRPSPDGPSGGPCRVCDGTLRTVYGRSRQHRGRSRSEVGSELRAYVCASCGAGELRNRDVDGWSAYPHGDEDREMLFAWELLPPDVERLREVLAGCPDPLRTDCTCAVHECLEPPQVPAVRIDVAEPAVRLPLVAVDPNGSGPPRFVGPAETSDRGAQPEGGGEIGRV